MFSGFLKFKCLNVFVLTLMMAPLAVASDTNDVYSSDSNSGTVILEMSLQPFPESDGLYLSEQDALRDSATGIKTSSDHEKERENKIIPNKANPSQNDSMHKTGAVSQQDLDLRGLDKEACENAGGYWCKNILQKGGTKQVLHQEEVFTCVANALSCACPDPYKMMEKISYYDPLLHKQAGYKMSFCSECSEQEFGTSQSCCPGYGVSNGQFCTSCSTEHNRWLYYAGEPLSSELAVNKTPDKYIYCVDCESKGTTSIENEYIIVKSADNNTGEQKDKNLLTYQVDSMGRKFSHTACNCPAEKPFVDGNGNCVKCGLYFAHWDTKLDQCVCDEGYSKTGYTKDGYLQCAQDVSGGSISHKERSKSDRKTESKDCTSNTDCADNEYCSVYNTGCASETNCEDWCVPRRGFCESVGNYEEAIIEGLGRTRVKDPRSGKWAAMRPGITSWWAANNWCEAQGMRLVRIEDFQCYACHDKYFYSYSPELKLYGKALGTACDQLIQEGGNEEGLFCRAKAEGEYISEDKRISPIIRAIHDIFVKNISPRVWTASKHAVTPTTKCPLFALNMKSEGIVAADPAVWGFTAMCVEK